MSKFPSFKVWEVRALPSPAVSIVYVSGGVLPFFTSFIINNLERATRLPAETWMIEGVISLPSKNPDLRKSVDDGICPLSPLDETAPETSFLQIPSSEAIQNHSTGAENGIGLSGSKDHRGRSGGRGDTVRIRYIFGKREFCEGSAQRDRSPTLLK